MKKFLSVLLLAAMVATMASCTEGDTETTTDGGAANTTTVKTTPAQTTPDMGDDDETTNPREVPETPYLAGDPEKSLESLLEGKTNLTEAGKIDLASLRTENFGTWNAETENIAQMFDGVKTEMQWYYQVDENGEYILDDAGNPVLKDGADPNAADGPTGGGPGKIGGTVSDACFFFSTTEAVKISAYVITTGNDNSKYPDRNPMEWYLYATNDDSVLEDAAFDASKWVELDYVYEGNVADANFAANGYAVDAANQGEYKHYCWLLGYTDSGNFQAAEFEVYVG